MSKRKKPYISYADQCISLWRLESAITVRRLGRRGFRHWPAVWGDPPWKEFR